MLPGVDDPEPEVDVPEPEVDVPEPEVDEPGVDADFEELPGDDIGLVEFPGVVLTSLGLVDGEVVLPGTVEGFVIVPFDELLVLPGTDDGCVVVPGVVLPGVVDG